MRDRVGAKCRAWAKPAKLLTLQGFHRPVHARVVGDLKAAPAG
jgi:hypothetical protein